MFLCFSMESISEMDHINLNNGQLKNQHAHIQENICDDFILTKMYLDV